MNAVLVSLLVLGGALFVLLSAVGLLRLPDVYCRSHALSKATTLGIACLLLAFWLADPGETNPKVLVAIVFQLVTIPVGSHLLCLTARRLRLPQTGDRPPEPDAAQSARSQD
jgi:multicomponent Na+:H+ antiporter subunit G